MTVELLAAYRDLLADELAQLDAELAADTFLFSTSSDRRTCLPPSSVSQRYRRMCARLGWNMDIKELRHYSATELVAAGVDVRTVAGRLGHGSGGVTTLRVYSAWRPEADRRAAATVSDRLPTPPLQLRPTANAEIPIPRASQDSSVPWRQIATDLRGAILCGALHPGDQLPTITELPDRYKVAPSTAHRAMAELAASGLVTVCRGQRAVVST